jgi:hypothetical protein
MTCPHCGLINPDSAQRCDCGYDFACGHVKQSYLERPARSHGPTTEQAAFRLAGVLLGLLAVPVMAVMAALSGFRLPADALQVLNPMYLATLALQAVGALLLAIRPRVGGVVMLLAVFLFVLWLRLAEHFTALDGVR